MARIIGVDIPDNKRGEIALTYIFGIGRSLSNRILEKAGVDKNKRVMHWTDEESQLIRTIITENFKVEGELKSEIRLNIKRLVDIGCYRGRRHVLGLPVRGQKNKK
jgi:small subunit ribosomal protein S13